MNRIKISEEQLNRVLGNILEEETGEDEVLRVLDDANMIDDSGTPIYDADKAYDAEEDIGDIEDELEKLLSPEEIIGLQQEQIQQLQDRVQYVEELEADILEFVSYLMKDLSVNKDLELKKSTQKLRALETRAGREIFWLKSRRL
tara:strand:- start:616 stop:1050 length:435 start_codon:yes stop_codon:yes gene_type:complete